MADTAHRLTDEKLEEMEKRLFQVVRPGLDGTQTLHALYWSAQIKVIQLVRSPILHCMPRLQKLGLAYI